MSLVKMHIYRIENQNKQNQEGLDLLLFGKEKHMKIIILDKEVYRYKENHYDYNFA